MSLNLPEKPELRSKLAISPHDDGYVLYDSRRMTPHQMTIHKVLLPYLERMTGARTLNEIHEECHATLGGSSITIDELSQVTGQLSQAMFLNDHEFGDYVSGPNRFPVCIGVYPEQPSEIRELVESLFTQPGGAGLPEPPSQPENRLRAVLLPHMDYARGNVTYGWGMKTLLEQTTAKLFVIVATSHYSLHRFTLTRKNFTTPLGTVPTDQEAIDWIVERYDSCLFDDPFAHLPEHSIEIEILLLQQMLKEPFRIVPLLVGSFNDCIVDGVEPSAKPDIARMVETLRIRSTM